MKKDLPQNIVENVSMAVVLERAAADTSTWHVYLINQKTEALEMVLVSSRGYGIKDEEEVKTSTLRHSLGTVEAGEYALIELIDEQVFGLTNEYWLSFYLNGELYDKKYTFLPESIVEANLIRVPVLNKPGVMIT